MNQNQFTRDTPQPSETTLYVVVQRDLYTSTIYDRLADAQMLVDQHGGKVYKLVEVSDETLR